MVTLLMKAKIKCSCLMKMYLFEFGNLTMRQLYTITSGELKYLSCHVSTVHLIFNSVAMSEVRRGSQVLSNYEDES